jgi:hypothetical protein
LLQNLVLDFLWQSVAELDDNGKSSFMPVLEGLAEASILVVKGEGDPSTVIADEVLWPESLSSIPNLPMMDRVQGF